MKAEIVRGAHRGALILKKYSPEILLGLGLVGGIGAAVLAALATRKVDGIIEKHKMDMDIIEMVAKEASETTVAYTYEDKVKDQAVTYVRTSVAFLKLYGPALALGTASVVSILASHGIMKRRQVAIVAAFNVVSASYKNLLDQVQKNYNGGTTAFLNSGIEETGELESNTSEQGTIVSKKAKALPSFRKSAYAVYFDECSVQWRETMDQNLFFLQCQQNYANDLLRGHGHVFLNEIYDALGVPRTKEGSITGWVYNSEKGDNYIVFDLHNVENLSGKAIPSILIDFNVDGLIFDKI